MLRGPRDTLRPHAAPPGLRVLQPASPHTPSPSPSHPSPHHSATRPLCLGLCSPPKVEQALRKNGGEALCFCRLKNRRHSSRHISSAQRGLLLCIGTLEFETHTAASTRTRPHAQSCVDRRLRGIEEGRTADGAASFEYDGSSSNKRRRYATAELTSCPPFATMLSHDVSPQLWELVLPCRLPAFASMWTVRKSSKSPSELANSKTRLSLSLSNVSLCT